MSTDTSIPMTIPHVSCYYPEGFSHASTPPSYRTFLRPHAEIIDSTLLINARPLPLHQGENTVSRTNDDRQTSSSLSAFSPVTGQMDNTPSYYPSSASHTQRRWNLSHHGHNSHFNFNSNHIEENMHRGGGQQLHPPLTQHSHGGGLTGECGGVPLLDPPTYVLQALRKQIEYYFCDDNLAKDLYLKKHMSPLGWVPIEIIANFPRVKALTSNASVVLLSLVHSDMVEISESDGRVRRKGLWMKWLLPQ